MNSRKVINIVAISVVCALLLAVVIINLTGENAIRENEISSPVELNNAERQYIAANPEIRVYVDEEVSYLSEGDGRKYIDNYLDIIFAKAGLQHSLTGNENEADCAITIVTKDVREDSENINFTAPIFQIKGKLYKRENLSNKAEYTGVVTEGRMKESALDNIKYNDRDIKWTTAKTTRETGEEAYGNSADFILGDEPGIDKILEGNRNFVGLKSDIYQYNVCIVTDKSDTVLASIINQCIHNTNRKTVSYEMSQKYLKGGSLLYMEKDYADLYLMALIIFIAIFIAFFIYYLTNKNLYAELSERMDLLAESKKELQTTMGSIGHYMAELTKDGSIMDINSAFYAFTGGNVANRKVWDVIKLSDENRELLERKVMSIESQGPVRNIEMKSEKRLLVIDIHPIENARGSVDKLLFMANDVTNERMAERQMRQDNKMIAVGQLAAGVAHEIRNPLGIIRNYCYVLKNMDDEELRKKAVEQIEKSVSASGKIVDSLLQFSRDTNKTKVTLDIEKHIESLLLLNQSMFKSKSINARINCQEEIRATLNEDSLDMVMINLISNAVAAMDEEGSLTIDIIKRPVDFDIVVTDTGSGISPENIDEIFNPFFTTKGDSGGTGLGLYIVYNEVSKMNGRINVTSEVGKGTQFVVTLPIEE